MYVSLTYKSSVEDGPGIRKLKIKKASFMQEKKDTKGEKAVLWEIVKSSRSYMYWQTPKLKTLEQKISKDAP